MFSLSTKTAFITGASSGIGRTLAKAFASAGAQTIVAARRTDRLKELVSEIKADGGAAFAVKLDVTDADSIRAAFEAAEARFGVSDILLNNAGIGGGQGFLETDTRTAQSIMDTNVQGVWSVGQIAAQRMVDHQKSGSIINIASILGLGAKSQSAAYCASKGAVVQLTRAMALDLARYNIRVNAIAPGWFVTEINDTFLKSEAGAAYLKRTPARRAGKLEELVGPALLLASDAGAFINGVILPVDGGHSASLV